jgi:hypothetical protein
VFSETHIHLLGCLCVRTGAKGRFLAREEILTRHLAVRLDGYSLLEPTPRASLLQHRQGSRVPTTPLLGELVRSRKLSEV